MTYPAGCCNGLFDDDCAIIDAAEDDELAGWFTLDA